VEGGVVKLTPEQYRSLVARKIAPKLEEREVPEKAIQEEIESWLKSLGSRCYYVRSRMDKAHTMRCGTPDFIGWIDGMPFALEVKRKGGKVTNEQAGELLRSKLAGAEVGVVTSLEQAQEKVGFLKCYTISNDVGRRLE
jgi:hypothetical protein